MSATIPLTYAEEGDLRMKLEHENRRALRLLALVEYIEEELREQAIGEQDGYLLDFADRIRRSLARLDTMAAMMLGRQPR